MEAVVTHPPLRYAFLVKPLSGICAVLLIAMLLIGNLIESAAHAGSAACVGDSCNDHVSHRASEPEQPLTKHAHIGSERDDTTQECCGQLICQAATLSNCPALFHPLRLETTSWAQIAQLAAVNRPRTLERPPNF